MPISLNGNGQVSGVAAFDTPTLVVDETNNRVGIGTATPSQSLHVVGVVQSVGTSGTRAVLNGGNSDGANIQLNRGGDPNQNAYLAQFQGNLFIKNVDSGATIFTNTTSDIERMRILSSGNIGINETSPNALLELTKSSSSGTVSSNPFIVLSNRNTTDSTFVSGGILNDTYRDIADPHYSAGIWFVREPFSGNASSSGSIVFGAQFNTDTGSLPIERMRINHNGDISIGGLPSGLGRKLYITDTDNQENSTIYSTNASYSSEILQVISARANTTAYNLAAFYSSGGTDYEFRFRGDGTAQADGTWTGGGADYAEYFEWLDGNPDNEDRRGIVVTLEGDKIKPAEEGDIIIGAISGNPSVIGDAAWNKWHEKYLRDDYGTYIFEDYEVLQWIDEEGKERAVDADGPDSSDAPEDATVVIQQRRKLNPEYDPNVEYINRENRPEWDCVGLMGKLRIRRGQPVKNSWIKMKDISDTVEEWLVV